MLKFILDTVLWILIFVVVFILTMKFETRNINDSLKNRKILDKTYLKIQKLDQKHESEYCKYSYNNQPFLYNNKDDVIDELAELRKRNDRHEQHLKQRVL